MEKVQGFSLLHLNDIVRPISFTRISHKIKLQNDVLFYIVICEEHHHEGVCVCPLEVHRAVY